MYKSLRLYFLAALIMLLSANRADAQLGAYTFSQSKDSTYTPLTTTPIPLDTVGAGPNYLRRVYKVPLPFTFKLGSTVSDSIWIDLAGFCALKATTAPVLTSSDFNKYPLSQLTYYKGVISPQGSNFSLASNAINFVALRTHVSGTTPNRVFTIEWKNYRAQTNRDMQVKLHETSHVIEFCYSMTTQLSLFGHTAEVGLRDVDTVLFTGQTIGRTNMYLDPRFNLRNPRPWDSSVVLMNHEDKMSLYNAYAAIPVKLRYIWTPPASCTAAANAGVLPDSMDICAGAEVLLTPSALKGGLSYQWQTSGDGSNWSNVTNGKGDTNFQYLTARTRSMLPVYYRLKGTCTANTQVLYSNKVKVKPIYESAPYFEGFEGISASDEVPGCIKTAPPTYTGNYRWYTYKAASYAFAGTGSIRNNTQDPTWLYTPGVYLQAGKQYRFMHVYLQHAYNNGQDSLRVGIGTLPTPDSITNIITEALNPLPAYGSGNGMSILPDREKYRRVETVFTVPASGIYFGGIRRSSANAGGFVDNIEIAEVPDKDMMADSILSPSTYLTTCFEPQMPVTIVVKNRGKQNISNISVAFKLDNTISAHEVITQTIPPGGRITYTFTQKAYMPMRNWFYQVRAWATAPGDTYRDNDTCYAMVLKTNVVDTLPYYQSFESSITGPKVTLEAHKWYGVYNTSFVSNTNAQSGNRTLRINVGRMPTNAADSVGTVPIGTMPAGAFLRFQYRMADTSGNTKAWATSDTVYVLARKDCGQPADTLMKIHAGMQTASTSMKYIQPVELAQYQGGILRVAFVTVKKSAATDIFLDIDSFQVRQMTPVDMMLASVAEVPSVVCAGSSFGAKIMLENKGARTATAFPIRTEIDGVLTTPAYTYTDTMDYQGRDTITLGNITISNTGAHTLKIYTQQNLDADRKNDTITRTVYVVTPPSAPAAADTLLCDADDLGYANSDSLIAIWYQDNQPGTPAYQVGNTLMNIPASDTFYVANKKYLRLGAGPAARHTNWSSLVNLSGYGLTFHALSDIILDSVGLYASGTGSLAFEILSCGSCTNPVVMGTYSQQFTNASDTAKVMVPVQLYIPAGMDYVIRLKTTIGIAGLIRDFPFTGFPLAAPGSPVVLSHSYTPFGSGYDFYYYFYDWKVRSLSACQSQLAPAIVRLGILPRPTFNHTVVAANLTTNNKSQGGGSYDWDFGDGGTATGFSPSHQYTANGLYTVRLIQTNECGTDTFYKNIVVSGAAGIADTHPGLSGIRLYPNPVKDVLHLSFTAAERQVAAISITDISGRILVQKPQEIQQGANTLQQDITGLAPGSYQIHINTGGHTTRLRFTVLK